jgi:hypothetical protein
MSITKLLVATSAILAVAGTIAAGDEPREGSDATSTSVAALRANLGNPAGLEVDEVRVTGAGVACIDYRVGSGQGSKKNIGHAVVQGNEVLKSSSGYESFEKAWNEHCLGPRGGVTSVE